MNIGFAGLPVSQFSPAKRNSSDFLPANGLNGLNLQMAFRALFKF